MLQVCISRIVPVLPYYLRVYVYRVGLRSFILFPHIETHLKDNLGEY